MASPLASILRLAPIAGPITNPIELSPSGALPISLGRSSACTVSLPDADGVVSRRHAEFAPLAGEWHAVDVGSKHGTFVNGNRLSPGVHTPMHVGDRVRLGPWTFRVERPGDVDRGTVAIAADDRPSAGATVRKFTGEVFTGSAGKRLDLLMQLAASMGGAASEREVADAACEAILSGGGFPRAAFVRTVGEGDRVEIISQRGTHADKPAPLSRSVLEGAARGATVLLGSVSAPVGSHSIASLGIVSAVCAPVLIDGEPDALLYADCRFGELRGSAAGDQQEAAAFCQAVARLCGLALSNLHRRRLESDDSRRRAELEAARDVQRIIMPPPAGTFSSSGGTLTYHMHSTPGRYVAGDLFDCFRIDDHRVAILLGDVVGKGIAAGMVMANVQAHLSRLLRTSPDPAAAVREASGIVAGYSSRMGSSKSTPVLFLSLWTGVIDLHTGSMLYVDAGHGYAITREPGQPPSSELPRGGPPVGVEANFPYVTEHTMLSEGERLYLFSDGLCEQKSSVGEVYGFKRALSVLSSGGRRNPEADIDALIGSLLEHTGAERGFADDVTVAAIEYSKAP